MTRAKRLATICLVFVLVLAAIPAKASASGSIYENAYNIYEAIAYADKYAKSVNNNYGLVYTNENGYARENDCTNFVSQCLLAGGIPEEPGRWDSDSSHLYDEQLPDERNNSIMRTVGHGYGSGYKTFLNVGSLQSYLKEKGYSVDVSVGKEGNTLHTRELFPSAGDIIQFDWEGNGETDHSMICCGYNSDGQLVFSGHTSPIYMRPFSDFKGVKDIVYVPAVDYFYGTVIYVIHMTDTVGLTDVTSRYVGKTIALKSLEANQYVSSNTDQDTQGINATANRSSASTWEYFDVIAGDYGAVGFKARGNGNYLSTRIDQNKNYAYIQAAYGQTYSKPQSWESFRIFEKGGIQYIQSQANGKWMQAAVNETDNPLKAAGAHASTWERFKIEIVNPSSGGNTSGSGGGNTGGTGGNTGGGTGGGSGTTRVSQYYHGTDYNEGWYEGEWSNGHPNGYGKLTYDDFGDGKYYALIVGGSDCKAIYYEGQFSNGWRYGSGTVVYENDYKDEGTFYGQWQAGKVVFEGKRWHGNGYWPCTITATSAITGKDDHGDWVPVPGSNTKSYTITYDANGGTGAPSSQTKTHDKVLTLSTNQPARSGYTFLGWATTSTASSPAYYAGNTYEQNSDITLYAVWKQVNRSAKVIEAYLGRETTNSYNDEEVVFVEYEITGYATGDIWLTFEDLATGKQIYWFGPVACQTRTSLLTKHLFTQGHTYRIYFTEDDRTKVGDSYVDFTYKESPAFSLSVPSDWARESIVKAYDMDLIPEYMMRDYSLTTTRIDFVRLAYNAIENKCGWMQQVLYDEGLVDNMERGPSVVFTDVSESLGYDNSDRYRVAALRALGIITGVGDNRFEPDRAITRQEAATLLSRVHSFIRWGEVKEYTYGKTDNKYTDNHLLSEWAFYSVYNMRAIDVMNGVGNDMFNPQGAYTIEQSIVTFVRLLGVSNRE